MNRSEWLYFVILGSSTMVLLIRHLINEIRQVYGLRSKIEYIKSPWNWLDITAIILISIITVTTMSEKLAL